MTDVPRQKLAEMVLRYGRDTCREPKRCRAYLRDVCGGETQRISVLITALEQRVAEELLDPPTGTPLELVIGNESTGKAGGFKCEPPEAALRGR